VILCRKGKAEQALQRLREIMGELKLTVNEEKGLGNKSGTIIIVLYYAGRSNC
jgi:hypothetical protein